MEENLDFLNRARVTYANLLIEIGMEYLETFPHASPSEFLDDFALPSEHILRVLKKEQRRLAKLRSRDAKRRQAIKQKLGQKGINCTLSSFRSTLNALLSRFSINVKQHVALSESRRHEGRPDHQSTKAGARRHFSSAAAHEPAPDQRLSSLGRSIHAVSSSFGNLAWQLAGLSGSRRLHGPWAVTGHDCGQHARISSGQPISAADNLRSSFASEQHGRTFERQLCWIGSRRLHQRHSRAHLVQRRKRQGRTSRSGHQQRHLCLRSRPRFAGSHGGPSLRRSNLASQRNDCRRLFRRWRPQNLAQVVSQQHLGRSPRPAFRENRDFA